MNIKELSIPCVKLITPEIHHDSRGYFLETFNLNKLESCLNSGSYVQDNETYSEYGVLRGIHFQSPPYAQSKLMRVIQGEVFDVIVDLRSDSPTFGKHLEIILTGDSKKMLYVPRGFAHGFLVMSEKAVFLYKVDSYYHPKSERTLDWKDKTLKINWPLSESEILLSEKDKYGLNWNQLPKIDQKRWES